MIICHSIYAFRNSELKHDIPAQRYILMFSIILLGIRARARKKPAFETQKTCHHLPWRHLTSKMMKTVISAPPSDRVEKYAALKMVHFADAGEQIYTISLGFNFIQLPSASSMQLWFSFCALRSPPAFSNLVRAQLVKSIGEGKKRFVWAEMIFFPFGWYCHFVLNTIPLCAMQTQERCVRFRSWALVLLAIGYELVCVCVSEL